MKHYENYLRKSDRVGQYIGEEGNESLFLQQVV